MRRRADILCNEKNSDDQQGSWRTSANRRHEETREPDAAETDARVSLRTRLDEDASGKGVNYRETDCRNTTWSLHLEIQLMRRSKMKDNDCKIKNHISRKSHWDEI